MSGSFCLYCGEVAKENSQEIFDETGIELHLNKLLEEHFHIIVEQDEKSRQVLCEECVNKLIDLYDLAELAKESGKVEVGEVRSEDATKQTKFEINKNPVLEKNPNENLESCEDIIVNIKYECENSQDEFQSCLENKEIAGSHGQETEVDHQIDCVGSPATVNGTINALEDDLDSESLLEPMHSEQGDDNESLQVEVLEDENFSDEDLENDSPLDHSLCHDSVQEDNLDNESVPDDLTIEAVQETDLAIETVQVIDIDSESVPEKVVTNKSSEVIEYESVSEIDNFDELNDDNFTYVFFDELENEKEEGECNSTAEDGEGDGNDNLSEHYLDELEKELDSNEAQKADEPVPDGELNLKSSESIDIEEYLDNTLKSIFHEMQFTWKVQCKVCFESFETFQDFFSHTFRVHYNDEVGYICTVPNCTSVLPEYEKLARHIILKHCDLKNIKIYGACIECGLRFSNFLVFNKHSCCRNIKMRIGTLNHCKKCEEFFPSWKRYLFHLQFHLPKQRPKICFVCDARFTDIIELFQHICYDHDNLIVCRLCDKSYEKEKHLKAHETKHTSKMKYQCPYCIKNYDFKNLLVRHMETTHDPKLTLFQCATCFKSFSTKLLMTQHLRSHKKDNAVEVHYCSVCGFLSNERSIVEQYHVEEKIVCNDGIIAEDLQGQSYVCEICNMDFKTPADVKAHRNSKIHQSGYFICRVCKNPFKSFFAVQNHIKMHKAWEVWLEKFPLTRYYVCDAQDCLEAYHNWPALYTHKRRVHRFINCDVCQKAFPRSEFDIHQANCKFLSAFKCPFCNKQCRSKMSLSVHVARTHNNSNVTCPHCKGAYKNKEKLEEHIKYMHTPTECQYCFKKIINERNYISHLRNVHYKEHKYSCKYCKKTFFHKSEKDAHEQNVHSQTTYRCSECNFETNYLNSVNIHYATVHKMEYEFKCQFCNKQFGRKQTLDKHEKRHKQNKLFECPAGCKVFFTTENVLKTHMAKKHRVKPEKLKLKESLKPLPVAAQRKRRKTPTISKLTKKDFDDEATNFFQELQIEQVLEDLNSSQPDETSEAADYLEEIDSMEAEEFQENATNQEISQEMSQEIPVEHQDDSAGVIYVLNNMSDEDCQVVNDETIEDNKVFAVQGVPQEDCNLQNVHQLEYIQQNNENENIHVIVDGSGTIIEADQLQGTLLINYFQNAVDDEEAMDFVEYLDEN